MNPWNSPKTMNPCPPASVQVGDITISATTAKGNFCNRCLGYHTEGQRFSTTDWLCTRCFEVIQFDFPEIFRTGMKLLQDAIKEGDKKYLESISHG